MRQPKRYLALKIISSVLVFVGWLVCVFGCLFALLGLIGIYSQVDSSTNVLLSLLPILSGLSIIVAGFLMVALGEIIHLFLDIAEDTAIIADNSVETAEILEAIAGRNTTSATPR